MARIESRYHYPEVGQVLIGACSHINFLVLLRSGKTRRYFIPNFLGFQCYFPKVEEFPGVGEAGEDEEEVKEESTDFTFAKVCFKY